MYGIDEPSLIKYFERQKEANVQIIHERGGEHIKRIAEILDLQYQIASHFVWVLTSGIGPSEDKYTVQLSALHKNLLAIYSALEMTRIGFYGAARPLVRQIFESLMIAKFCSVSSDATLLQNWLTGQPIYIGKKVMGKIISPSNKDFEEFWGIVCEYTHASIYSQQVHLNSDEDFKEIALNFAYMYALLECNYHLLNSHFVTPSLIYYAKYYSNFGRPYNVPALRNQAKSLSRQGRTLLGSQSIKLVVSYKATWQLAP